jgi:Domain of unknown function (DUF4345)
MQRLASLLRVLSPIFVIVAAIHLVLGLNADALLGASVPPSIAAEPSLSSQNRFYGVAFALYGAVLYLCAKDLRTYEAFFKAAMWVFLLAGVARLVSWVQHGAPAPMIIALLLIELVVPPVLLAWHARAKNEA